MEWDNNLVLFLMLCLAALIGVLCKDLNNANEREAMLVEEREGNRKILRRLRKKLNRVKERLE